MLMNLLTDFFTPEYWGLVGEAAIYAVIGFAVVFLGIGFLIFVVWLVGLLMSNVSGATAQKPKKETVKVEEPLPAPVETEEIDEETVAVIMAALMAYYEKNNPKCEFTVKRIKRVRRNDYA